MSLRYQKLFVIFASIAFGVFLSMAVDTRASGASVAVDAKSLYADNCSVCHGDDGRGAEGMPNVPDFTSRAFQRSRTDKQLTTSITAGKGTMPGFKGRLKPEEIQQLVRFIRSFGPKAAQTSASASSGEGLLERALKGQARIIDLTQTLSPRTPTFGGERDAFRYERLSDISRDGYASGAVRFPEHFGTHLDAPGHFIAGRETADRIPADRFITQAVVIDIRDKAKNNPDYRLSVADIETWERSGAIPERAAVLLLTGWSQFYGDAEEYRNADANGVLHFPGFSEEAIAYLVKKPGIVALGADTLSIDYGASKDFAGHKISHSRGLYHLENLTNLDKVPARGAVIFVGALPIEGGSGSPSRVLAIAN